MTVLVAMAVEVLAVRRFNDLSGLLSLQLTSAAAVVLAALTPGHLDAWVPRSLPRWCLDSGVHCLTSPGHYVPRVVVPMSMFSAAAASATTINSKSTPNLYLYAHLSTPLPHLYRVHGIYIYIYTSISTTTHPHILHYPPP